MAEVAAFNGCVPEQMNSKHEIMHIIKGVDKLDVWSINLMFSQGMTV